MARHLTVQQRYEIFFRLQNKERPIEIAKALGVHRSTISRELRRNKAPHGKYSAEKAQWLSDKRMSARNHYTVLTDEMKAYIDRQLTQSQWSPEQISGRRRVQGLSPISHETIYRYVWDEKRKWESLCTCICAIGADIITSAVPPISQGGFPDASG